MFLLLPCADVVNVDFNIRLERFSIMGQMQPKLRGGIVFLVKKREDRIKLERIDFPLRSEIENDYKSTSESCEGQRNIDSSSPCPKKVSWKNDWWFKH